MGINFRGTGSIRENREHLYPQNIPAIQYAGLIEPMMIYKNRPKRNMILTTLLELKLWLFKDNAKSGRCTFEYRGTLEGLYTTTHTYTRPHTHMLTLV